MKTRMKMLTTFEMRIDTLPFPEPLPIPELLAEYHLKKRAVAALTQSPEFKSILMYIIFREEGVLDKFGHSLRVPTLSMLQAAAEQAGDIELTKFLVPRGDHSPLWDEPQWLLEEVLSRFSLASVEVTHSTFRKAPDPSPLPPAAQAQV